MCMWVIGKSVLVYVIVMKWSVECSFGRGVFGLMVLNVIDVVLY